MKVIKINSINPESEIIQKAAKVLELGGAVVYPTETLYGLGSNPFDEQALQRVFEIKGRDLSKPVSLAFRNIEHAEKFAQFNETAKKLAKKFLPGPLTMILPAKMQMNEILGGDKIGIRIPDDKVAQKILEKVKSPTTATSANLSGGKDPVEVKDVIDQLGDKVDLVIDAGKCKYGKPSTVVDCSSGEIEIIREGVIPKEKILSGPGEI